MKSQPTADQLDAIAALAQAICQNPRHPESLSAASRLIATGRGDLLFEALLSAKRSPEADENTAIGVTMAILEAMMDVSPGVAGYLMARLYPIAGRRRLHETYNAIELWMHESMSEDLATKLAGLALEGVRPKLRTDYETWAAKIRERCRPKP